LKPLNTDIQLCTEVRNISWSTLLLHVKVSALLGHERDMEGNFMNHCLAYTATKESLVQNKSQNRILQQRQRMKS